MNTTEPEDNLSTADEALLDSLLSEVYQNDGSIQRNEARIQRLLAVLSEDSQEQKNNKTLRPSRMILKRIASFTLAASILFAIGYLTLSMSADSQAYAAVTKIIEAPPAVRAYQITMINRRPIGGEREIKSELFVDESDRFVFHRPGRRGFGELWVGGDSNSRWFVASNGPAFVGDENMIGNWLAKQDVLSPYLHLSTVLNNLRKVYRLKKKEDVDFEIQLDGQSPQLIRCQHLIGKLQTHRPRMPSTIELWADAESNVVQRLELRWDREKNESGPLVWSIDYRGKPSLPENWFSVEGHISEQRPIINVDSETDLPKLSGTKE